MLASLKKTDWPTWQAQGLLLAIVVFCGSGATCNRSFYRPFASLGPPAPEVLVPGSSLDQVIAAVNQNASRVQSIQTNNASITVSGMPSIPLLRGNIVAQRPRRIRFQASTALTGPEVDLGSNDQLFWFWVKRSDQPALYFVRHDQYAGSAAGRAIPVDPDWVMDAIGLAQLSTSDQHEGPFPYGEGKIEIRSMVQSPSAPLRKSTIVDSRRAWILEQHLYDNGGTLLASVRARSHRYLPEIGVSLPQEIELHLPAAQLNLSIDMGTVAVNQLAENPALWSLPVMSGVPQVDLGSTLSGSSAPSIPPQVSPAIPAIQPTMVQPPATFTPQVTTTPALTQQLRPGGVPVSPREIR